MRGVEDVRLAELLASISLAFDLGVGRPLEHTLRAAYLAGRLSQRLGLSEDDRRDVFYASVLQNMGCVAYTPELVRTFVTDDIVAAEASPFMIDPLPLMRFLMSHVGSAGPLYARPAALVRAVATGEAVLREHDRAFCEVGALLARRLGLGEGVAGTLLTLYERWDGGGVQGMHGADIPVGTRIITVATHAEIYFTAVGEEAALASVKDRAGAWFDPEIAATFCTAARQHPDWTALDAPSFWEDVLALEPPGIRRTVEDLGVDNVAETFADFVDMKAPSFVGHSRAVARLAERAARLLQLPEPEVVAVRRAGLLHDLGRIALSNTILEKRRALTPAEQEKVRLHPYYTERVLTRTPALAPLAPLAGAHHERLDGSGYHRGARAGQLAIGARVIAAADACHALTEERAYRPARSVEQAVAQVREDASQGRLDHDCVEAVAKAMGARGGATRAVPGLTAREVEVLRELARARSEKEIATRLGIGARTAHHHIEHIYGKLGVSTRAGAVLQGIARGLLDEPVAE